MRRIPHRPGQVLARLWPWLPLLLAGIWLAVLAADLRAIVQAIYANADFAAAPVLGELYDERQGMEVTLGNFAWYSTLWFEQLTADLPGHRQIWQLGPWLFSLLGVAALAWATWRAAGAWAAMIVAVVLGCAGPALLTFQFGGSLHAPAYAHACFLGAFLVLCAHRGGRAGSLPVHAALCALLAAVTAVGWASDELLLPAGVAPFLLAALAMRWLLPAPAGTRILVSAAAICAAAGIGAALLVNAMEAKDVVATPYEVNFATWDRIAPNFRLLLHSMAFLFNGDFGGREVEARTLLELLCALAILTAAFFAIRHGRRWVPRALATPAANPREAALRAHVAFWLLGGAVLATTFVFSSVPVDRYTARYVLSVGYAVVAIVAAIAAANPRPWARALVVAGTCAVLVSAIAGLVRGDIQDNPSNYPDGTLSGQLERFARAEGVTFGYAGYWTAAPLTWQTKAAVKVYPVKSCTGGAELCPYQFHRLVAWYRPRPGQRSLLVIDPFQTLAGAPTGPDPAFGRPRRVTQIAYRTIYVYDYDIASRFHD